MKQCTEGCSYQVDLDGQVVCIKCKASIWSTQVSFEE